jgi:RNA-directed DNA polymerase
MQKKLSQWATEYPHEKRRDLYSLLCNESWLRMAQAHIQANQGSETAGTDGMTMTRYLGDLDGNILRLQASLKAKTFEPQPVRRTYIPKANGKKRPIGIPTIDDRIVQEALRMILEPIWESDFSLHSYGFRPNRSTYDAMTYIGKRLTGNSGHIYQWVIEGDITSYFGAPGKARRFQRVQFPPRQEASHLTGNRVLGAWRQRHGLSVDRATRGP